MGKKFISETSAKKVEAINIEKTKKKSKYEKITFTRKNFFKKPKIIHYHDNFSLIPSLFLKFIPHFAMDIIDENEENLSNTLNEIPREEQSDNFSSFILLVLEMTKKSMNLTENIYKFLEKRLILSLRPHREKKSNKKKLPPSKQNFFKNIFKNIDAQKKFEKDLVKIVGLWKNTYEEEDQ